MEVLPRPDGVGEQNFDMWVDEAIWGHRLYDEQTPWLSVLEFLGVFKAEHLKGMALKEPKLNALSYRPMTQLRLRNLLFNNPHVQTLLGSELGEDELWRNWLGLMNANAGGVRDADFGYVRKYFETFGDFASVLHFLQTSAIENNSNKRWSSKFVFPLGPTALYEDLNVKSADNVSSDRRFFARSGELLYLMLSRSQQAEPLAKAVVNQLMTPQGPFDGLLHALQGEDQPALHDRDGAYLPCTRHPVFDRLAQDWLAILGRPMPPYDMLPHLVTMTGLNLGLYQLERARELMGQAGKATIVCKILAPKRTVVREISANSYQALPSTQACYDSLAKAKHPKNICRLSGLDAC